MISRLHSFDDPVVIEERIVFALETYCAGADGRGATRIEEEVVVTADGPKVISRCDQHFRALPRRHAGRRWQ